MFFYKPKDYLEPKANSLERQNEMVEVFPGTQFYYDRRFLYIPRNVFARAAKRWISEELSHAVIALDIVRAELLKLYKEIEATFPDGLSKQSAKADRRNTHEAFPGGPTRDIYEPIRDIFLKAEEKYDERNTELVPFKVSEWDANS